MTEFERGVRVALCASNRFKRGTGPSETQFGIYQMTLQRRILFEASAAHLEKTIQAILLLDDGSAYPPIQARAKQS